MSGSPRSCSPTSRRPRVPDEAMESVESFRLRARAWLAENMPRRPVDAPPPDRAEDEQTWIDDRALQRKLWDGGFAGICFPEEYGGLGLTIEHQHAFTEESLPYEMPLHLNVPNFSILGATLVDYGTHEQKAKYLPLLLQGKHQWVQFLSEPTGGSDLAGCVDPGRSRRRRVGAQRLEDLEHRGDVGHARDVPGPHRLGRAEAPRPHDVPHGDPPARGAGRPDQAGERLARVLPGVLRRRPAPARLGRR